MSEDRKPDLAAAYALRTPEDSRRLYRDWASSYDEGFAAERDYIYHQEVARLYAERADPARPVLDIGAGTGLVGRALAAAGIATVDGLDISPEMLAVAAAKGGYRAVVEADLTARLPLEDGAYGGVVSAGTFTHGHVGPEALGEALRVAAPGAVLALGVNAAHFEAQGFAAAFDRLAEEGALSPVEYVSIRIYGDRARHAERDHGALVAVAARL